MRRAVLVGMGNDEETPMDCSSQGIRFDLINEIVIGLYLHMHVIVKFISECMRWLSLYMYT